MDSAQPALQESSARLRRIVSALRPEQIEGPSYDRDWTIGDVLSHLGSGAVIFSRSVSDSIAGETTPDDFRLGVWDEWNAKSQADKAADALAADRALVEQLDSMGPADRERFHLQIGPLSLDFEGSVRLRLNEHAVHTWDVEVIGDPAATIAASAVPIVVDNVDMVVRFAAKPATDLGTLRVHTTSPERDFLLTLSPDGSSLEPAERTAANDLELPAEAFIRLLYGRLDPAHTPEVGGSADLDVLGRAFPGL